MRWTGAGACTGHYATSLGKIPLPVTELARGVACLTGLATGLRLDLNTLDFLQTTISKRWVSPSMTRVRYDQERTSYRMRSLVGDVSCVSVKAAGLRERNVGYP